MLTPKILRMGKCVYNMYMYVFSKILPWFCILCLGQTSGVTNSFCLMTDTSMLVLVILKSMLLKIISQSGSESILGCLFSLLSATYASYVYWLC